MKTTLPLIFSLVVPISLAFAAPISVTTNQTYTQNFNTLFRPTTTGNVAASPAWTDDSTIPGWWFYRATNGATGSFAGANYPYNGCDGSIAPSLDLVSQGTANDTDRAFASPSTTDRGEMSGIVLFRNTGTSVLEVKRIKYNGEVRRTNSTANNVESIFVWHRVTSSQAAALTMATADATAEVFPSAVATSPNARYISGWTQLPAARFTYSNSSAATALNISRTINATLNPGTITLAPNEFLAIRFSNINDGGTDALMGIDDLEVEFVIGKGKLFPVITNIERDNKGSPTPVDDTVKFTMTVTGTGTLSPLWRIVTPVSLAQTGAYGTPVNIEAPLSLFTGLSEVERSMTLALEDNADSGIFGSVVVTAPCFGEGLPGLTQNFDGVDNFGINIINYQTGTTSFREFEFARSLPPENLMEFRGTSSGVSANVGITQITYPNSLDMQQFWLLFEPGLTTNLFTERIDTRGYTHLRASLDLIAQASGALETNDTFTGTIFTSTDGVNYTERPWFKYTGGTGLVQQVLAEEAPSIWYVATSDATDLVKETPSSPLPSVPHWVTAATPPQAALWKNANKGLGFENSAALDFSPFVDATASAELQTAMLNVSPSVYIRYPFFSPAAGSQFSSLRLNLRFDDAYVIYLNGFEVARSGVTGTTSAGTLKWNTTGTARADTSAVTTVALTGINKDRLLNGANLLCVHLLNDSAANPVALFHVSMDGTRTLPLVEGSPGVNVNSGSIIPASTKSAYMKLVVTLPNDAEDDEAFYADNLRIDGAALVANNFYTTIRSQLPSATDAELASTADPDNDGISNLIEYALTGNAGVHGQFNPSGSPILPQITVQPNGFVLLKYNALGGSPQPGATIDSDGFEIINDIKYRAQMNVDGSEWFNRQFRLLSRQNNPDGSQLITLISLDPLKNIYQRCMFRLVITLDRESFLLEECFP